MLSNDQLVLNHQHHQEHRDWMSKLDFYQDEIKIFQNELVRVIQRYPQRMAMLEHVDEYRRILLKKLKHIDDYRRQIAIEEARMTDEHDLSSQEITRHKILKHEINKFFEGVELMKRAFRRFVAYNN